jgi:hypothetical protein
VRRVAALLALACVACGTHVQTPFSDLATDPRAAEKPPGDEVVKLPPFPHPSDLVRFDTGPTSSFDFFIDPKSLSVDKDQVIRFTVVAKSAGATNIAYEGLRCQGRERKVYAYGRPDGTWREASHPDWVRISAAPGEQYRFMLYQQYFCAGRYPIRTAAEGVDALRRGGHPRATEVYSGSMTD